MEFLFLDRISEIKKEKKKLEDELNVKISLEGKKAILDGSGFDEYQATRVLEALGFGFSVKKALTLKSEDVAFRKIPIKNFTRRKNLRDIKARIVGSEGRTKKTIEEVSGCFIILHDNVVGILGSAESIEEATTAIVNLIRGSKQANVYRFLERINAYRKENKDN